MAARKTPIHGFPAHFLAPMCFLSEFSDFVSIPIEREEKKEGRLDFANWKILSPNNESPLLDW